MNEEEKRMKKQYRAKNRRRLINRWRRLRWRGGRGSSDTANPLFYVMFTSGHFSHDIIIRSTRHWARFARRVACFAVTVTTVNILYYIVCTMYKPRVGMGISQLFINRNADIIFYGNVRSPASGSSAIRYAKTIARALTYFVH